MGRQALQEDGVRGGMAVMAAIEARNWAVETNGNECEESFLLTIPFLFSIQDFQ
jgi:hypothetical protein